MDYQIGSPPSRLADLVIYQPTCSVLLPTYDTTCMAIKGWSFVVSVLILLGLLYLHQQPVKKLKRLKLEIVEVLAAALFSGSHVPIVWACATVHSLRIDRPSGESADLCSSTCATTSKTQRTPSKCHCVWWPFSSLVDQLSTGVWEVTSHLVTRSLVHYRLFFGSFYLLIERKRQHFDMTYMSTELSESMFSNPFAPVVHQVWVCETKNILVIL